MIVDLWFANAKLAENRHVGDYFRKVGLSQLIHFDGQPTCERLLPASGPASSNLIGTASWTRNAQTVPLKNSTRSRPQGRNGDLSLTIAGAPLAGVLLTLAVTYLHHNVVHRCHDGLGSLFQDSMIAILNHNLFTIRGKASEFGL